MLRDHAVFVQAADGTGTKPTGASLQTRVSDLEAEVSRLREQLGKAKGINDTMWETVVQRLVAEGKEKKAQEDQDGSEMDVDGEGEGRRRKRGRV